MHMYILVLKMYILVLVALYVDLLKVLWSQLI